MFMPKGLREYLRDKHIDSADYNEAERTIKADVTLDEETKKKWLKYCKFAFGADIALTILTGTTIDKD